MGLWFYNSLHNTNPETMPINDSQKSKALIVPIVSNNRADSQQLTLRSKFAKINFMVSKYNSPERIAMWKKFIDGGMSINRMNLDRSYAPLFVQLKLSPDEIDLLKDLLVELNYAKKNADLQAASESGSDGSAKEDIKDLEKKSLNEITENIASLLGDQRFEIFAYYEETLPQRDMVDKIALQFSYDADPLSAEQKELLIDMFHEQALKQANDAKAATGTKTVSGSKAAKQASEQFKVGILEQAAPYLTDSQIESLKKNWNPKP